MKRLIPMIVLMLVAAACGDSAEEPPATAAPTAAPTTQPPATDPPATEPPATTSPAPTTEAPRPALGLEVTGLEALANGFHYEGWAIIDGAPVTTGKFNVGADGSVIDLNGAVIDTFEVSADLAAAEAIVITIEPSGDVDEVPATTKILGGPVVDGVAELTIAFPAALGDDFTSAAGTYILGTPTDDPAANENSGVWFLAVPGPVQSVVLPVLPDGWAYEGWAVIDGTPVTTGTFTDVAAADAAAPYSGPNQAPPFPGEDFITNAPDGLTFPVDLSGGTVVISIEPSPDDSPAPFTLKPLVGQVPDPATDHTNYDFGNKADAFPTAVAVIG